MATELNPPITAPSAKASKRPSGESEKPSSESTRIPAGSTEIIYCDQCGKILLNVSSAVRASKIRFCKDCGKKRKSSVKSLRVSDLASRLRPSKSSRKESATAIVPAKPGSSRRNYASQDLRSGRRGPVQAGEGSKNSLYIAAAVGGGTLLLALGVIVMSSGGTPPVPQKQQLARSKSQVTDFSKPQAEAQLLPKLRRSGSRMRMGKSVAADTSPVRNRVIDAKPVSAQAMPIQKPVQKPVKEPETVKAPPVQNPIEEQQDAKDKALNPFTGNPGTGNNSAPKTELPVAPEVKDANPFDKKDTASKKDVEEEELLDDGTGIVKRSPTGSAKSTNPFAKKEDEQQDKQGRVSTPKPAPKPAWEKGKYFDLFPKDRESVIGEHVSPAQDAGQHSGLKETQYHGWSWASRSLTGYAVKDGILSLKQPGSLTLDPFSVKEFDVSFEVKLARNSSLGFQYGTAKGLINLLVITSQGVLSGTWAPSVPKNNIKTFRKDSKPFTVRAKWMPLRVMVRKSLVEVFVGNKSLIKLNPPGETISPRFGFLLLGQNQNKSPSLQMRKVIVYAP